MGIHQPLYQFQKLICCVLLAANYVISQLDVIVDFKTNPGDIFEGMDVVITCQISNQFNPETDHLVIYRKINADTAQSLATHLGKEFNAPENIEFGDFTNNTLRFTISNVHISDSRVYTCVASRKTGVTTSVGIGYRDIPITVQDSYPPVGQLQCSILSEHSKLVLNDGEMLQLTCSSPVGSPQAELQWSSTGNIVIQETEPFLSDEDTTILSALTSEINRSFDGVSFTCSRQSKLFPVSDDSCVLGPFYLDFLVTSVATSSHSMPTSQLPKTSAGLHGGVIAVIIIVVLLVVFSVMLLFIWKSGRIQITCNKSKDNCPETTSDDGNRPGERVYETRISDNRSPYNDQGIQKQNAINVDLNQNLPSKNDDQYIELNLTDVENTTYTELKSNAHSTNPNESDELPKYTNVRLTKTDTGVKDQYMGLNMRDSEVTAYMGLIKGNRDENIQLSSENQGETENSGYGNADFKNETSDYVNVE